MKSKFLLSSAAILMAITLSSCLYPKPKGEIKKANMFSDKEAIANILERKSVRNFTGDPVSMEKIDIILKAGMAAPSSMDRRPWEFIVVSERHILDALADKLPLAQMLRKAPVAIIVCGDTDKSTVWFLDCSAATQNILLAAEALNLGAVWTSAYPLEENMQHISQVLGLPANILPLAVVPVGNPTGEDHSRDKFDPTRIHHNKW